MECGVLKRMVTPGNIADKTSQKKLIQLAEKLLSLVGNKKS